VSYFFYNGKPELLFGAQQSVLGRDTICLDSPKCMVLCLSNAGYGRKRIANSIQIYMLQLFE